MTTPGALAPGGGTANAAARQRQQINAQIFERAVKEYGHMPKEKPAVVDPNKIGGRTSIETFNTEWPTLDFYKLDRNRPSRYVSKVESGYPLFLYDPKDKNSEKAFSSFLDNKIFKDKPLAQMTIEHLKDNHEMRTLLSDLLTTKYSRLGSPTEKFPRANPDKIEITFEQALNYIDADKNKTISNKELWGFVRKIDTGYGTGELAKLGGNGVLEAIERVRAAKDIADSQVAPQSQPPAARPR
jgi:hypothetical protein